MVVGNSIYLLGNFIGSFNWCLLGNSLGVSKVWSLGASLSASLKP